MTLVFWIALGVLFYTWLGYPLLLFLLSKALPRKKNRGIGERIPSVAVLIAAYNEEDYIEAKLNNCKEIDYPASSLSIVVVCDGSNDKTLEIASSFEGVKVFHEPERKGKTAAINRVMPLIQTEIVVFSDCNTMVDSGAVRIMVDEFCDPGVGCVSGEKRIQRESHEGPSGSGEGLYWKYESLVKKLEASFGSVMGAAGELFAIRRDLFQPPPEDAILDDFVISLRIALAGFRISYHPNAFSIELPSANIQEEMKRKTRISAGDYQTVIRMRALLNPWRYGRLSFQFWSHKVFRWTLSPIALFLLMPASLWLILLEPDGDGLSKWVGVAVISFYFLALIGFLARKTRTRFQFCFLPYFFVQSNLSFFKGFFRSLKGKQSAAWEKARRAG